MKTKKIVQLNRHLIIAFLLISWTSDLYSQQVIKFKSGREEQAIILHQTKDTLEYHLTSEPDVSRVVSMEKVDTIFNIALDTTMVNLMKDKKYLHYRHVTTAGVVLASTGAVISLLGIIIMSSAATVGAGAAVSCVGGALLMTGTLLAVTQSAKMKKYENKLRGFSFDVMYAPHLKGISLVYRF
jgi:hypothetical protein